MSAPDHLRALESEAVHIFREVAAELERPVLMFSGGKDSIVLLRLAEKAFRPGRFPFPVLHVDTGHNFPEVHGVHRAPDRRARRAPDLRARVEDTIDAGRVREEWDKDKVGTSRNRLQTADAARRDRGGRASTPRSAAPAATRSAPARRSASSRSATTSASGTRARSGPELWNLYNGRIRRGEHVRVFPLSNWTELDVWHYIEQEELELPAIYFAHEREVFEHDGMLYAVSEYVTPSSEPFTTSVRYRTVGDMTITGAVRSEARDVTTVISEIQATRITERGETRADDRTSEAAMEDRKRQGYF